MSLPAVSFATCSCSSCWIRFMGSLRRQRQGLKRAQAGSGAMFFGFVRVGRASTTKIGFCHVLGPGCGNGPKSGLFARLIGLPEVSSTLPGQPLGLGLPEGLDAGVVAAKEHIRDGAALEQLRPRIVRVFQKPLGEALLGCGGV